MSWNTNWLKAQIHTNKLLLLLKTTSKIVDNGPLHILLNIERNAGIALRRKRLEQLCYFN